jgi:hypothetical protein
MTEVEDNTETKKKQITSIGLLDQIIDNLMEDKVFHVAHGITRETSEYDKWVAESISLSNNITKLLLLNRHLFDRFEELCSLRESELLKNTYAQGFRDGIELLKAILYEGKN